MKTIISRKIIFCKEIYHITFFQLHDPHSFYDHQPASSQKNDFTVSLFYFAETGQEKSSA